MNNLSFSLEGNQQDGMCRNWAIWWGPLKTQGSEYLLVIHLLEAVMVNAHCKLDWVHSHLRSTPLDMCLRVQTSLTEAENPFAPWTEGFDCMEGEMEKAR